MLRKRATNVQRHYDIGDDLFEAFLDPTLTYSCGFANTPHDSLETLQLNKLERASAPVCGYSTSDAGLEDC